MGSHAKNEIYPLEGDAQLLKQAPGRIVDVKAVQTDKKGMLLPLEVVLK